MANKNLKHIFILFILSYLFLILGNGILSLTNPDEVFYAQTAKEMIQHKSWLTPYLFGAPQFEKPVFLYWLLRIGLVLFPNTNFAVRFFPALFASFGVIAVYFLALIGFQNEKKAFISSLILLSCGLYIGLARTLFTDMIFSIFILFSLLSFYWSYSWNSKKGVGIILFFIFSALAVLTKGPLGFLIPLLSVLLFLFIRRDIGFLFCKYSLWGFAIFVAVSLPWYVFMIIKYGSSFTHEFFYNDHIRRFFTAEHLGNDKWYFYPFSMIGCMFPWSLYTLASLIWLFRNIRKDRSPINIFLFSWVVSVFIIFQPAHSKLVSYIFPMFPALALITGNFIYSTALFENKNRALFVISIIMAFILFLIPAAAMFLLPKFSIYLSSKIPAYAAITLLFVFSGLFLSFILRKRFLRAIFTLSFMIPALLFIVPFIHNSIEPYVSSKLISEYLLKNYKVTNPIICSKFFARGVRYYTDKEIVIIGSNFFSPHPVTCLGSDQQIKDYLRSNPVTYCILKKSSAEDIKRIADKEYKFSILKIIGNEYLLQIEHI